MFQNIRENLKVEVKVIENHEELIEDNKEYIKNYFDVLKK